jgi:hypothetical protein
MRAEIFMLHNKMKDFNFLCYTNKESVLLAFTENYMVRFCTHLSTCFFLIWNFLPCLKFLHKSIVLFQCFISSPLFLTASTIPNLFTFCELQNGEENGQVKAQSVIENNSATMAQHYWLINKANIYLFYQEIKNILHLREIKWGIGATIRAET